MSNSNIIWRIDDRLIHGQVIVGWCSALPINKLIVCDDEIAGKEWERSLLSMAAPPDLPTEILSIQETVEKVKAGIFSKNLSLILLKSPKVLQKLIDLGITIEKVIIGGIHFQQDRKEYLPYIYLSEGEVNIFKLLMKKGIKFECQDLPTSSRYDLKKLLEKKL